MEQADFGDIVVIELKVKHAHESLFSSPFHFKFAIGRKKAPLWLEEAAIGMKLGESKTLKISANKIIGQNLNVQSSDIIHDIKLVEIIYLRTNILNYLIKTYNFTSYLEIGSQDPENNFNYIDIDNKISVDPQPKGHCDYIMTSDMFFESYCGDRKFDLIFIDGLHLEEQVTKDFHNSLVHLNKGGIIVLHDCNPLDESRQLENRTTDVRDWWNGTCWKSFVELRMTRPDLQMHCVDCDEGCGIIKKGKQELYANTTLDQAQQYSYLETHRKELLNLITFDEFKDMYKS